MLFKGRDLDLVGNMFVAFLCSNGKFEANSQEA